MRLFVDAYNLTKMAKSNPNGWVGILKRRMTWILVPAIVFALLPSFFVDTTQDGRPRPVSGVRTNASRLPQTTKANSSSIEPWKLRLMGFALGLVIGVVLALVVKPKEASRKEGLHLTELTGVPVLASIPAMQRKRDTGQNPSKPRSKPKL
jgi:hypothetical protein